MNLRRNLPEPEGFGRFRRARRMSFDRVTLSLSRSRFHHKAPATKRLLTLLFRMNRISDPGHLQSILKPSRQQALIVTYQAYSHIFSFVFQSCENTSISYRTQSSPTAVSFIFAKKGPAPLSKNRAIIPAITYSRTTAGWHYHWRLRA